MQQSFDQIHQPCVVLLVSLQPFVELEFFDVREPFFYNIYKSLNLNIEFLNEKKAQK